MRARSIIEELFTNAIQHGYRNECEAPLADGLGVYLVGKRAYDARYEYDDGHNQLWLVMPR